MAHIDRLPREVLLRVFNFYLETESQFAFFKNVAEVSELWKDVCQDACLWEKFDGTLPLRDLVSLIKEERLKNTKTLVISHARDLPSSKTLQTIFEGVPNLRCINFSNISISMMQMDAVICELETKCPYLCKIIFNDIHPEIKPKLSYNLFQSFFELRGKTLLSLDFSNLQIYDFVNLFELLASSCPNLEQLLFLNLSPQCANAKFPIEKMQNGCPKLKVLSLGLPLIFSDHGEPSPGFTELEVFTYCADLQRFFNDSQFKRLLFNSSKLKVLDIRGSTYLKARSVYELPTAHLEELYVSRTRICYNREGMLVLLHKWAHTLRTLDISRMPGDFINGMFDLFFLNNNMPRLESLDLNSTAVRKSTIKLIVDECKKLNYLQLESCRELGRGRRHAYCGRKTIEQLVLNFDEELISNC